MNLKNVLIFGAGGVGGFIAAKTFTTCIKHNLPYNIYIAARGNHLKEIQSHGLTVTTSSERYNCKITASDNITVLPKPDLILLTVKSYDLEKACLLIKKTLSPHTILVPLLNGVDIYEQCKQFLTNTIILPSCIYISSYIEAPGQVKLLSPRESIICGPDPMFPDFSYLQVQNFLKETALNFNWFSDPFPPIWKKYMLIASFALVTAAYHKTFGEILENPALISTVQAIITEIMQLANQKGLIFPPDTLPSLMSAAKALPYETKTSYQRDLEIPGKPNEGNLFGETILRLGSQLNIPTPISCKVYQLISKK